MASHLAAILNDLLRVADDAILVRAESISPR
jgi:hypothetical protein